MKEVLEHGSVWNDTHKEQVCPHCGCKFIFDRHEIKRDTERTTAYSYEYVGDPYIECPECGHRIENFVNFKV